MFVGCAAGVCGGLRAGGVTAINLIQLCGSVSGPLGHPSSVLLGCCHSPLTTTTLHQSNLLSTDAQFKLYKSAGCELLLAPKLPKTRYFTFLFCLLFLEYGGVSLTLRGLHSAASET